MPGSSLWLLPPSNHPLIPLLTSLTQRTAAHFNSPHLFIPHVTLTSGIPPMQYGSNPQAWLDALQLSSSQAVKVRLGPLCSENVFVRKLYAAVDKKGVTQLAQAAAMVLPDIDGVAEAAERWVETYNPHLSLLYHDCEVVGETKIREVEAMVRDAGINLEGEGRLGGWEGGRVVLVETEKPIKEWEVIAERTLELLGDRDAVIYD